jgi:hypothetical protein
VVVLDDFYFLDFYFIVCITFMGKRVLLVSNYKEKIVIEKSQSALDSGPKDL